MSLPDAQIETSFAKTGSTDLAHFRSGNHPDHRRWHHSVGISGSADCVLSKSNLQNTYGYDVWCS